MKRTLIIHIGWYKTATSTIQNYFHLHRSKLLMHDICYPVIGHVPNMVDEKHMFFYLSIPKNENWRKPRKDIPSGDDAFQLCLDEILNSNCRYSVISEEGFSEPTPSLAKFMGRFKPYFDDIKIVAFVRRQDFFLESIYAQRVRVRRQRLTKRFKQFIHRDRIRKHADYEFVLNLWAQEFGVENIIVAPFEKHIVKPDPTSYFFKISGLPMDVLDKFLVKSSGAVNVTPPREMIEFYRHMNAGEIRYPYEQLKIFLENSSMVCTDTRYFAKKDREMILDEYRASNETVAKTYLQRESGILFENPVKDYPNCPETWNGYGAKEFSEYAIPIMSNMLVKLAKQRYFFRK